MEQNLVWCKRFIRLLLAVVLGRGWALLFVPRGPVDAEPEKVGILSAKAELCVDSRVDQNATLSAYLDESPISREPRLNFKTEAPYLHK